MRIFENKDCMEGMREYPDKFFDLAIVDPPYGIGEDGRKSKSRGGDVLQINGNRSYVPSGNYTAKNWDSKPVDDIYFEELLRVSKNQIIWGCNYYGLLYGSAGRIVWDKVNGENDFSDCEMAYCSFHESIRLIRYMWNGMMQGKSLEEGHLQQGNKSLNEKRIHPTQKPVLLYKWLLNKYAKPADKILDTHTGSASSLIACEDLGFDYVAFELDEEYYDNAVKRIEQYRSQLKIF